MDLVVEFFIYLEDFWILRFGHQQKIMRAIKRVKDILAVKYVPLQM
jgi:hypothetical protein